MKRYTFIQTALICFFCLSFPQAQAKEPVLARLSFHVPPQQMAAFEAAYLKTTRLGGLSPLGSRNTR